MTDATPVVAGADRSMVRVDSSNRAASPSLQIAARGSVNESSLADVEPNLAGDDAANLLERSASELFSSITGGSSSLICPVWPPPPRPTRSTRTRRCSNSSQVAQHRRARRRVRPAPARCPRRRLLVRPLRRGLVLDDQPELVARNFGRRLRVTIRFATSAVHRRRRAATDRPGTAAGVRATAPFAGTRESGRRRARPPRPTAVCHRRCRSNPGCRSAGPRR